MLTRSHTVVVMSVLTLACAVPRKATKTVTVTAAVPPHAATWSPSPGHAQVQIWPGTPPVAQPVESPRNETETVTTNGVTGRAWVAVSNVRQPTMTVYSPQGKNTGAAVVVFPGGGYRVLAIDLEGTEVCDWLTSRGVTCVLLKYRVPGWKPDPNGPDNPDERISTSGPYPRSPMALEDAQRTLGLVRAHAAEWQIDPKKVGVLGFSAGGHLAAATSTHFERVYPLVDDADKESCRPDFAIVLYPGHLNMADGSEARRVHKMLTLNPDVPVSKQTPPTFLVHAEDDPVDDVENSLVYFEALRSAGVPVEMHLFPHGGHGFGLRTRDGEPITSWPRLAEGWMRTIGIVP